MRIYSYQLKYRKPSKKIFLKAASMIETEPENILFVGDRINKDVCGAMRAGMKAALKAAYTNEGQKRPEGTIEIERIAQLPGIIEEINLSADRP